ncbi:MAG: YceI family protein [Rubricoccaceae bacterium]|nr:YceI family protein [Rubricoccaceae bacterium]
MLALLASALLGAALLQPVRYEVASESRFWIEGTSTVGDYTCATETVSGYGVVGDGRLAAEVAVPVRTFDCGSGPQNADFYRALRAEAHPAIRFELERAEALGAEARPGAPVRVRTTGTLYIAGTARQVTLDAVGRRLTDGRVAVEGHQRLRMTDFGVEPPSHALGLIRAHDPIVVRFDLVAAAR